MGVKNKISLIFQKNFCFAKGVRGRTKIIKHSSVLVILLFAEKKNVISYLIKMFVVFIEEIKDLMLNL